MQAKWAACALLILCYQIHVNSVAMNAVKPSVSVGDFQFSEHIIKGSKETKKICDDEVKGAMRRALKALAGGGAHVIGGGGVRTHPTDGHHGEASWPSPSFLLVLICSFSLLILL
ncbi:uncharacterized protein LOC110006630 isoform X2 [Amborella trichopoda]|uniref:Uncharacterized protein n=1 Tax=Amborella trichopoda TaxID=13333 RepID=W1NER8_AMBTC|nr:uncharacterized protein LOC110006630 isoform X2 [Amborella trichopoda]ERM93903.1 hypothetical protein AMTR_s00137p00037540 [Amborella trichopoda]|eukprot:XP_020518404.1 uncharacterized protein LOC110006630 isoform X2 [Amborella trichopoda]